MSPFHSDTVRLPPGRPAGDAPAAFDRGDGPVVLRFPERSRVVDSGNRSDKPARPLWIHGYRGKRTFDIVMGGLLSLAVMPIATLVGLLLLLLGGGRVLDRTAVIGRDGRSFLRLRFRTRGILRSAAPSPREGESEGPGHILPLFEAEAVPRTRFGRFLHSTGLERLPELWNVLRGDLTLIGPAARTPDDGEPLFHAPPRWDIKPGFVWLAPAGAGADYEAVMRYVATQGIRTDLRILAAAYWRLLVKAFQATKPE